ncbi:integration host factor subunit alpha [Klebsiella variicola]|uniref:Integration host factor subunit alpha n=2 Tax=Bacteria TaxID=2 RepID=A0A7H4MMA4_KLEVA|nr:integration host factor subunit alpha [Klebsiella variicola]
MCRGIKRAIPGIIEGLNLWRLQKLKCQNICLISLGLASGMPKNWSSCFSKRSVRALENGEQVKLSGFGNFDLRDKNQRPGRNPKTGEDIPITARRVVTFRPGQKLKSRVENASPKDK